MCYLFNKYVMFMLEPMPEIPAISTNILRMLNVKGTYFYTKPQKTCTTNSSIMLNHGKFKKKP